MSAPENRAPFTRAPRKFTLRKCARSNRTFERSHRKNSTPLAWHRLSPPPEELLPSCPRCANRCFGGGRRKGPLPEGGLFGDHFLPNSRCAKPRRSNSRQTNPREKGQRQS